MHKLFLPLYRFFQKHHLLMYLALGISFVVFLFFGLQLRYEEDILKLLPRSSTDSELAFSDIDLKDKVFIQVTSATPDAPVPPAELGRLSEAFCRDLLQRDSATAYISHVLYAISPEQGLGAMDYALAHLPTLIDTAWYGILDAAMTPEAIEQQMARNADLLMADETGLLTQTVSMDPLNLRSALQQALLPDGTSAVGFTLEEGHLFCPDKTVALSFLSPAFSPMDSGASTRFVRMFNRARRAFEADHPEVRILAHGNPLGSVSNAGTIKRDLVLTIGLSLLVILVILLLSFHSTAFVSHQVCPLLYGTAFALACMYWIKGSMSLMALGIGAVVLGVAISYCLHVIIHYYYTGDVERMLREESTPVVLGCLTTVGAFIGLLFTESELLSDFGLFATLALLGNTFYALVFLPHFLRPSQIRFKRVKGFPLVERFNALPWDRHPAYLGILAAALIVGIVASPRVRFDSDLRNLDYDDAPLTESQNLYNEKNADGFSHLFFAAYGDTVDEAIEAHKGMGAHLKRLQQEHLVHGTTDLAALLLVGRQDQRDRISAWQDFWSEGRLATLRARIREAGLRQDLPPSLFEPFFALLSASYEPGDLLASGILPPELSSNFIERQDNGRVLIFTSVAFAAEDKDQVISRLVAAPQVLVLEPFYYCRDMVEIIHDDFNTTVWISSLFVLLVLLVSFRNLWIALLCFFPMFTSWFVLQGYMALTGLEFNLINIVISTFIYGIGVDYSIFVMEGLLAEARTGSRDMLDWHKSAIFYSALVLVIVTSSLVFATHPAIRSIGFITLIGMVSTILITYSLQPFLFRQLLKVPRLRRRLGC